MYLTDTALAKNKICHQNLEMSLHGHQHKKSKLWQCTNHLLPWGSTPRTPMGTQGELYSFGISFFLTDERSFLVLETTKYGYVPVLDHRDVAIRFVLVLVAVISLKTKVSLAILFHSMPNFDVIVYTSLQGRAISHQFCALSPKSFEWFLFVAKDNSLGGVSWRSTHREANDKCI